MRHFIPIIALAALAGCNVSTDPEEDSLTVDYDEETGAEMREDAGLIATDIGEDVEEAANDAQAELSREADEAEAELAQEANEAEAEVESHDGN